MIKVNGLHEIETVWFTTDQSIGIVLTINEQREIKAYIKTVKGYDQEADTKDIMSNGNKFPMEGAKGLFKHLDFDYIKENFKFPEKKKKKVKKNNMM